MSLKKDKLDGLYITLENLKSDENKDLIKGILDIIKDLSEEIEKLEVNQEALEENLSFIDKDISEIQEDIFEELTLEELDVLDDEYVEVKCDKCDKELFIEKSALEENKSIPCPYCNNIITL